MARIATTTPYIPCFSRSANILRCWQRGDAVAKPDLVFVDGHGIRILAVLAVASHFGLLVDVPTIGVAKTALR